MLVEEMKCGCYAVEPGCSLRVRMVAGPDCSSTGAQKAIDTDIEAVGPDYSLMAGAGL